ncbi:hypothetical protein MTO96_038012 [Rhipicephalus appendiculatus]
MRYSTQQTVSAFDASERRRRYPTHGYKCQQGEIDLTLRPSHFLVLEEAHSLLESATDLDRVSEAERSLRPGVNRQPTSLSPPSVVGTRSGTQTPRATFYAVAGSASRS